MTKLPTRLLAGNRRALSGLAAILLVCCTSLFAGAAPATAHPLNSQVANLDGDWSIFLPGGTPQFFDADPAGDGMGLAVVGPDPATSFAGGALVITQRSGTLDGSFSFFTPTVRAGADGQIDDGEPIATANSRWAVAGRVAAGADGQRGRPLRIEFGQDATALSVEDMVLSLMYTAPTGGERRFALLLEDGHGGVAGPLVVRMVGE